MKNSFLAKIAEDDPFAPKGNQKPSKQPVVVNDDPFAPKGNHSTGLSNTQPTQKSFISPSVFAAVKEMQQAIINFGKTAAGMDALKLSPQGTGTQETSTGEYLGGHDPFSSFLFSNYLNIGNENKSGQGYVATENLNQKTRQDTAQNRNELSNLRNWIETIMHVGSPLKGGEYQVDGIWGVRTNNGLKAIADFSKMMFNFASDMQINLDEFPTNGIDNFISKIPNLNKNGTVEGITENLAKELTSYINTLSNIVSKFKSKIVENPSWKEYLSQDKPLLKGNTSNLTRDDKSTAVLHGKFQLNLSDEGVNSEFNGISLNDLSSKEKFINFLKGKNISTENSNEIQQAITKLRQYLKNSDEGKLQATR